MAAFVRRFPLERGRWFSRLPLYLGALLLFSVLHTTGNWLSRELLFPLAGLGDYDYGILPIRYAMELGMDAVAFSTLVLGVVAYDRLREARRRELVSAQLEANLAKAQLSNLRRELQPHFLFNALNTVSSLMYSDPKAADTVLERLGDLLRASLRTARRERVTVAEELELLSHYTAIQQARFGERLVVRVNAEDNIRAALLPSFLLQPLVENAVRHGKAEREGRGSILVSIERRNDELVLTVEDDGPGTTVPASAPGEGLGFAATSERLELLYPGRHHFAQENLAHGGFRVTLRLPWEESDGGEP